MARMVMQPAPIAHAHPARALIQYRRLTIGQVAEGIGRSRSYVGKVLKGRYPAASQFRADLAA